MTGRSPNRAISRPPPGAKRRRKNANAQTTIELAVAPTPKLWANCGSTGGISPNPRAMTKADAMSTQSSRGMRTFSRGSDGGADTITSMPPATDTTPTAP